MIRALVAIISNQVGDKTFEIFDYKCIKELKNVDYKTYGVHSKYTLQQNFYAEILEANGCSVKDIRLVIIKDNHIDGYHYVDRVKLKEEI